jgi:2-methylcitrate dehydratase PrpD
VSLTRDLAERVWDLTYTRLEDDDLAATRSLLLDHLGVAANGATTDSGRAMQTFAVSTARGSAPIVGTNLTASPLHAAMANAVAAHSIEYDDVHNSASSHPAVAVIPAAMAAAAAPKCPVVPVGWKWRR